MADLKIGTTVGGSAIWTQAALNFVPVNDSLTYRGFKVYTEFDRPTAAEVGAYSKSETYSKQEVDDLGKLRVLDVQGTNYNPSQYPSRTLSTFLDSGAKMPTAKIYSGVNVRGRQTGSSSWQLSSYSDSGASDNKLWFRTSLSDATWNPWARVYTTSDRPTPAEVGAVNKAGDSILGDLTLHEKLLHNKLTVASKQIISATTDSLYVGNTSLNKLYLQTVGGELYVSAGNVDHRVFHKGFLPNKVDVGLPLINNWEASSSINDPSNNKYATSAAVNELNNMAFVYALIL